MRLNQKQRDFLIEILGKVVVYVTTIVIIGKLLNKEIGGVEIIIAGIIDVVLVVWALLLAKAEDK